VTKQKQSTYDSLFPNPGVIKLPYKVLVVEGSDAEKFLQGQLSCDLAELGEGRTVMGTANTPKGRIYGLFKIIKHNERFLLRIHDSMADIVVARLSKYKVFFKCTLQIDERYNVFGAVKPPFASDNTDCPEGKYLESDKALVFAIDSAQHLFELWTTEAPEQPALSDCSAEDWACMESIKGLPEIYPATSEAFILQYLNLHELGAVSFKKGCYTGQEIIARMKFLGKLKKRTFLLHCSDKTNAQPGDTLYDQNTKKCGKIVRTHYSSTTGTVALAVLSIVDNEADRNGIRITKEQDKLYTVSPLKY
jgi:folate-binding protein YgfZ